MRLWACVLWAFAASPSWAQWEVPVRIQLEGATDGDRQVSGLAAPTVPDAAVSVNASRGSTTTFTTVVGSDVLTGDLLPAPSAYSPGMIVTVVPTETNQDSVMLDLNGLGPRLITSRSGLPLNNADLPAGMPARLIYDGETFRLLSALLLPCPSGFYAAGREYCIETESRPDTSFYGSLQVCRSNGTRLCTMGEWVNACLSNPAFLGTVLNFEWVDSAANNGDGAKRVGNGGDGTAGGATGINCLHGGSVAYSTGIARIRCCANR